MTNSSTKNFWLAMGLIFVALIYFLGPILSPFLIGALLSYMGNPLVDVLERYKVPRTLAVTIVMIVLTTLVSLIIFSLIPLIERQIDLLIQTMPQMIQWVQTDVLPWLTAKFNLPASIDASAIIELLKTHWQQAGSVAVNIVSVVSKSGLSLVMWLSNLVLVPVVTFYLLRDWHKLLDNIQHLLPRSILPTVLSLAGECNEVLGAFFRGQLLVMFGLGVIYTLGLSVAGLDMALLIGLLSGLVSIVPYLGFIFGIVAASIAALFQFHDTIHLVYVFLAFGFGQIMESTVLTPLLVGDRIGLHPVAVIFAILAGGQLFGFVGVLLALPVSSVLMVLLRHFKQKYIASDVYQDVPA
jgi:predicted PurR-regulated permease PerM